MDESIADACACPSFTLGRRRLLATAAAGAGVLAGAQLFGDAFRQVAYGAAPGGNVVVVLSMRGGADGLSMVVPRGTDYDVLAKARPSIVVPKDGLLTDDARFGLHPAFAPLMDMWRAGTFGAVHSVGLPAPNRSHFDAMVEIEDAAVNDGLRSGWINRTVGLDASTKPENAMQMGTVMLPTSLTGSAPALGANQVTDLTLAELYDAKSDQTRRRDSVQQLWGGDAGIVGDSVREAVATVQRLSPLVTAASATGSTTVNTAAYPKGALQSVLANTAALIKAKVGARIVTVDYGNWDMHVGLGTAASGGWMYNQVDHLAKALAAFFADLGADASRVTVVTMSEFGRRVAQNGSAGLDHGYGNAMLLLGAGVNGGGVRGEWAGLSTLRDGDVAVRQNFQSVLWEVMRSRFPDLSGAKASIFPDLAVPETVGSMV